MNCERAAANGRLFAYTLEKPAGVLIPSRAAFKASQRINRRL